MAKVKDLKKGIGLLKKKPIIAEDKGEKIVKKIHTEELVKKETAPELVKKKRGRRKVNLEETTRYTIDLPDSIYKAIRHKVVDEGGTMKAFIMKAIKKELNIK